MTRKTVKGILRSKIADWLESIENDDLRKMAAENVICTGGAILSLLTDEKVNDFDLYFKSKDAVKAIADYYVAEFLNENQPKFAEGNKTLAIQVYDKDDRIRIRIKSAGIASDTGESGYAYFEDPGMPETAAEQYVEKVLSAIKSVKQPDTHVDTDARSSGGKYKPVFLTDNAITLSSKIQLIIRFYGTAEEIHKNFDFVHCTNLYDYATDTLALNEPAQTSIITKELRYIGSLYPVASIFRMRKFVQKGWKCNVGQIFKMIYQCGELDLNDVEVLQDQLTGVDVAYFQQLLTLIHEDKKSGKTIDAAYIIEVMERLF